MKNNISCLAITKNGKVSGVVSERDFVRKIIQGGHAKDIDNICVEQIGTMGKNVAVAMLNDTVGYCLKTMVYIYI